VGLNFLQRLQLREELVLWLGRFVSHGRTQAANGLFSSVPEKHQRENQHGGPSHSTCILDLVRSSGRTGSIVIIGSEMLNLKHFTDRRTDLAQYGVISGP
jgi:hypothetical protein